MSHKVYFHCLPAREAQESWGLCCWNLVRSPQVVIAQWPSSCLYQFVALVASARCRIVLAETPWVFGLFLMSRRRTASVASGFSRSTTSSWCSVCSTLCFCEDEGEMPRWKRKPLLTHCFIPFLPCRILECSHLFICDNTTQQVSLFVHSGN